MFQLAMLGVYIYIWMYMVNKFPEDISIVKSHQGWLVHISGSYPLVICYTIEAMAHVFYHFCLSS